MSANTREGLSERIASAAAEAGTPTTDIVSRDKPSTLGEWFKRATPTLGSLVAKSGLDMDRFERILFLEYRNVRNLSMCTIDSVGGAILKCAYYGLEPGDLGHAWLIPFWNRENQEFECQFMLGYKGMLELFRRASVDVEARPVHEGDIFEYAYGTDPFLEHRPQGDPKGRELVCHYGVAFQEDHRPYFWVVWPSEIGEHKQRSAAVRAKVFSPWVSDEPSMQLKTVVRIGEKWIPKSIFIQEAFNDDGKVMHDSGVLHDGQPVINTTLVPENLVPAPEGVGEPETETAAAS